MQSLFKHIVTVLLFVGVWSAAIAQESTYFCNHSKYHEWYKQFRDKNGQSCCNSQDCRCAVVEFLGPNKYRVRIATYGKWYYSDERTQIRYSTNGSVSGSHACLVLNPETSTYTVRCIILATGV